MISAMTISTLGLTGQPEGRVSGLPAREFGLSDGADL